MTHQTPETAITAKHDSNSNSNSYCLTLFPMNDDHLRV